MSLCSVRLACIRKYCTRPFTYAPQHNGTITANDTIAMHITNISTIASGQSALIRN